MEDGRQLPVLTSTVPPPSDDGQSAGQAAEQSTETSPDHNGLPRSSVSGPVVLRDHPGTITSMLFTQTTPSSRLALGGLPTPIAAHLARTSPKLRPYLACAPIEFSVPVAELLCGPGVSVSVSENLASSAGHIPAVAALIVERDRRSRPLQALPLGDLPTEMQLTIARGALTSPNLARSLLLQNCDSTVAQLLAEHRADGWYLLIWLGNGPSNLSVDEAFALMTRVRETAPRFCRGWVVTAAITNHPVMVSLVIEHGTPDMVAAASATKLSPTDAEALFERTRSMSGHARTRAVKNLYESPWVTQDLADRAVKTLSAQTRRDLRVTPRGEPAEFLARDIGAWLELIENDRSLLSRSTHQPTIANAVLLALADNPHLTPNDAVKAIEICQLHGNGGFGRRAARDAVERLVATYGLTLGEQSQRLLDRWLHPPARTRILFRHTTDDAGFSPDIPCRATPTASQSPYHRPTERPFADHDPRAVADYVRSRLGDDSEAWLLLLGLVDEFDGSVAELCDSVQRLTTVTA